jgi:GT2 family glycosyltransferase
MKKKQSVAIVILSWNDPINTIELIESIMRSDYSFFDIILVDNNSDELKYREVLKKIQNYNINFVDSKNFNLKKYNTPSKSIFVIRSTEVSNIPFAKNIGVSRGYNKGINFALKLNYDYLVKLDCDFIVSQNFIYGMIKTLNENINAVAVSPKVYYYINKKTSIIWWKGINFSKNYFRFQRTGIGGDRKTKDIGQFNGLISSEGICGCCVMFRTEVIKKTGLLDEDFFFGPEDIEHSFRLKKFGKILVNLDYIAYHKVSQSIFVSGVKSRIYFETIGWLLIIKKVCNRKDKMIGYLYFIVRGARNIFRLIYKKDKDATIGFLMGLKDYFIKY